MLSLVYWEPMNSGESLETAQSFLAVYEDDEGNETRLSLTRSELRDELSYSMFGIPDWLQA